MKIKIPFLSMLKVVTFSLVLVSVSEAGATVAPLKGTCKSEGAGVEFEAVGNPSLLKILGKGAPVQCDLQVVKGKEGSTVSGKFVFNLESLDTGIGLRNKHMKEKYLEVGRFPTAELNLKDMPFKGIESLPGGAPFKGSLTLHGVTQEVQGTFSLNGGDQGATGEANFEVDLKDYQVAIPSFAGITVSKVVKIKVPVSIARQ